MKFLLDVCADSRPLRAALADLGHDVLSARERFPNASDEALLALAREENRVLVTEDKDFGELVFLRGLPHPGIVRLVEMTPRERAEAMRTLIERHADKMRDGAIIVVTETRVRIRSTGPAERNDELERRHQGCHVPPQAYRRTPLVQRDSCGSAPTSSATTPCTA